MAKDQMFQLTPKGYLGAKLLEFNVSMEESNALWNDLQGFCMSRLRMEEPDAAYAALIFDGGGGIVIGAEAKTE
uniref:Uncharacterized protein n=1 Tax=viral metagenome TaxID=1070528 RepID=A0A6H1ZNB6_9ZZZZ